MTCSTQTALRHSTQQRSTLLNTQNARATQSAALPAIIRKVLDWGINMFNSKHPSLSKSGGIWVSYFKQYTLQGILFNSSLICTLTVILLRKTPFISIFHDFNLV